MSKEKQTNEEEKMIDALMPEFNDDVLEDYQNIEKEETNEEEFEQILPEEKPTEWNYEKNPKIVGVAVSEGDAKGMKFILFDLLTGEKVFVPKWKSLSMIVTGKTYMLQYNGKKDKLHDVTVFVKK